MSFLHEEINETTEWWTGPLVVTMSPDIFIKLNRYLVCSAGCYAPITTYLGYPIEVVPGTIEYIDVVPVPHE